MTAAAQVMDGLEDAVRSAGVRYIRIDGGTDMRVAPPLANQTMSRGHLRGASMGRVP